MPGLVLKGISKSFGATKVLRDIDIELDEGELLVLLGPSGCGKSTLLRIIAGLEEADTGEVYIGQRRVDQLRPRERNVALVFQNYSLYPHMTVAKNLAFPLKVAGIEKEEITARVNKTAELLGLSDRLADKPSQLSGGQRQRVALGRAIIREPSIFLLDEPLSNLDADLRMRMRQEIVNLQKQLNRTMVHVTHDQAEALTMADRIALINNGRLEQMGTPEELYKYPANLFVATFVGQPKINLFDGMIESGRLAPLLLELPDNRADYPTGKALIGVRPEAISIRSDGEFPGRVVSSEYLGDHYVVVIAYKELTLTAITVAVPPDPGRMVMFSIPPKELLFFEPGTGRRLSGNDQPEKFA
ncbi:MAG TPA: ABC transporter ATP-binding protein [Candidatus Acidoferrum sp.]|nr:ABC transporter ATP-binding protein [Candidatus Acidoferrum sp.]